MPEKLVKGELLLKLNNFEGLPRVEGKNFVFYKLKQEYFTPEATCVDYRDRELRQGFMKKYFDWEKGIMNCRIPLDHMMSKNMHMQGDTAVV